MAPIASHSAHPLIRDLLEALGCTASRTTRVALVLEAGALVRVEEERLVHEIQLTKIVRALDAVCFSEAIQALRRRRRTTRDTIDLWIL